MNKSTVNPFEILSNQLADIKKLLIDIKYSPKEDYSNKYYSLHETANLLNVNYQSVRNYIASGLIEAKHVGKRKKLVHHYSIFNEDGTLKELKYGRTNSKF